MILSIPHDHATAQCVLVKDLLLVVVVVMMMVMMYSSFFVSNKITHCLKRRIRRGEVQIRRSAG